MKMTNRNTFLNPVSTMSLWLIPVLTYTFGKVLGVKYNNHEWFWWIIIPSMLLIWFLINYKIVIKNEQN